MALPSYIAKYFWDIDKQKAVPKTHPQYYIGRILEFGDKKAFGWLKKKYGLSEIKKIYKKLKLSPKSASYWRHILN